MLRLVGTNWWLIVLRGICAIVFGVFAWTHPGATLGALILLFGAYAFVDGILSFASAISGSSDTPWWALLLEGLVSFGAAAAALFFPGISAVVLLWIIAAWAIVTGALEIVAAIQLRKVIEGEVWLGLAGLGSVLFGLLLMVRPAVGALAVMWLIGLYAVFFGILLVALGFRMRTLREVVRPA